MAEEIIVEDKQNFIKSLNCIKQAWENLEQTPITEDDVTEAKNELLGEDDDTSTLLGKTIKKDLLCHIPTIALSIQNDLKNNPPENDLNEDEKDSYEGRIVKEKYSEYSSSLDNPYDLAVGFFLFERLSDNCETTSFYNVKLSDTIRKLSDIFQSYGNHLKYSECLDKSAIDTLNENEPAFSMMGYDEAVEAIGEVIDTENSATHTEL